MKNERVKHLGKAALLFILLYLIMFLLFSFLGLSISDTKTYMRWDSYLYHSVAADGFTCYYDEAQANWQGNAGWYFLYPLFAKLLSFIPGLGDITFSGLLVSALFLFAYIYILDKVIGKEEDDSWTGILTILFFPGWIYLAVFFPMSLCLFGTVLNLYFMKKEKYTLAGLAGILATASYSTGMLVCAADLIYIVQKDVIDDRSRLKKLPFDAVKSCGIAISGFVLQQILVFLQTGYWNGFFLVQEKYGHGIHNPFDTLAFFLTESLNPKAVRELGYVNIFVFVYLIVTTVIFVRKKQYKDPGTAVFYYYAILVYVFMLVMGKGVWPMRQYLLMSISVVCWKDCSQRTKNVLLCITSVLSVLTLFMFAAGLRI